MRTDLWDPEECQATKDNLMKVQRKALKELRNLEDEVVLPADKGNATVVMRRL